MSLKSKNKRHEFYTWQQKSYTHIPAFTFVEPLFGLWYHQSNVIRSILEDVNGGGMRQPFQVYIIHRDQAITCINITTVRNCTQQAGKT